MWGKRKPVRENGKYATEEEGKKKEERKERRGRGRRANKGD